MNTSKKHIQLTTREYTKLLKILNMLQVFVSREYLPEFNSYIEALRPSLELVDTKNKLRNSRSQTTRLTNKRNQLIEHSKSTNNAQLNETINQSIVGLNNSLRQHQELIKKLEVQVARLEHEIQLKDMTILNKVTEINSLLELNNQLKQDLLKAQSTMPVKKKDTSKDADIKRLHLSGISNRAIAKQLEISPQTVNNRIKEFFPVSS